MLEDVLQLALIDKTLEESVLSQIASTKEKKKETTHTHIFVNIRLNTTTTTIEE